MFREDCKKHKAKNCTTQIGRACLVHFCKDKIIKTCEGCDKIEFKKAAARGKNTSRKAE